MIQIEKEAEEEIKAYANSSVSKEIENIIKEKDFTKVSNSSETNNTSPNKNSIIYWVLGGISLTIILGGVTFWIIKKKNKIDSKQK